MARYEIEVSADGQFQWADYEFCDYEHVFRFLFCPRHIIQFRKHHLNLDSNAVVITAFTLITLPVEYDASNRALAWLTSTGTINASEHNKAADALTWAARTYLVAALASMAQLAYYISLLSGRD